VNYLLLVYLGVSFEFRIFRTNRFGKISSILDFLISLGFINNIFFLSGILLMIITLAKVGITVMLADQPNFMHFNFGMSLVLMSIFGGLIQADYFTTRSINFTIPMLLICIGFMFGLHQQYNRFEYFIHRTFGILSVVTGMLLGISDHFPKFQLIFLIFALLTPITFVSAAPIFAVTAMIRRIDPVNYVFLQANMILIWILLICGAVYICVRCGACRTVSYDKLEEIELELKEK